MKTPKITKNNLTFNIFCLLFLLSFQVKALVTYNKELSIKQLQIGNILRWTTANETDNQAFSIEKSLDGISFEEIGQIKGKGNSSKEEKYSFLDPSIGENTVFYRLKAIDVSGDFEYSTSVAVERDNPNDFIITGISGERTDKIFTINLESSTDGDIRYQVSNFAGKVFMKGKQELAQGKNTISLNVEDLPVSSYSVKLRLKQEIEEVTFGKVNTADLPKVEVAVKNK